MDGVFTGIILGVIVGVITTVVFNGIAYYLKVNRLKYALRDECKAAYKQIPFNIRDFCSVASTLIAGNESLHPSKTIGTTVYQNSLGIIYPHLKQKERKLLHEAYEKISWANKFLENFRGNLESRIIMFKNLGENNAKQEAKNLHAAEMITLTEAYKVARKDLEVFLKIGLETQKTNRWPFIIYLCDIGRLTCTYVKMEYKRIFFRSRDNF